MDRNLPDRLFCYHLLMIYNLQHADACLLVFSNAVSDASEVDNTRTSFWGDHFPRLAGVS